MNKRSLTVGNSVRLGGRYGFLELAEMAGQASAIRSRRRCGGVGTPGGYAWLVADRGRSSDGYRPVGAGAVPAKDGLTAAGSETGRHLETPHPSLTALRCDRRDPRRRAQPAIFYGQGSCVVHQENCPTCGINKTTGASPVRRPGNIT